VRLGAVRNTAGSACVPGAPEIVADQRPGRCHAPRPAAWVRGEYAENSPRPRRACPRLEPGPMRAAAGLLPRPEDSGENAAPPMPMQQRLSNGRRVPRRRAVAFSHLILAVLHPASAITDGDRAARRPTLENATDRRVCASRLSGADS